MKSISFLIPIIFLLLGCSNQSELSKGFDCDIVKIENSITISDFKKNFTLDIPMNWKTELYYNENQSEIFTADTIKQLTESFILVASHNFGELIIDEKFHKRTDSVLKVNNLQKINSGQYSFQSKPSYWYLVNGKKNGFNFHQLNILVKTATNTFFTAYIEIYGDSKIEDRICESIALIEKVEFSQ